MASYAVASSAAASTPEQPKAELRKQQSGFLMFLKKAQAGQSSERAGQAKRVLEEYNEMEGYPTPRGIARLMDACTLVFFLFGGRGASF